MELHLAAIFDAVSSFRTVYRSRIKVDAFELLQANSEAMRKRYERMATWHQRQLKKQLWHALIRNRDYKRRKQQKRRKAD